MNNIENEVKNENKKMSKTKKIIVGVTCFVVVSGGVALATVAGIKLASKDQKSNTTNSQTDYKENAVTTEVGEIEKNNDKDKEIMEEIQSRRFLAKNNLHIDSEVYYANISNNENPVYLINVYQTPEYCGENTEILSTYFLAMYKNNSVVFDKSYQHKYEYDVSVDIANQIYRAKVSYKMTDNLYYGKIVNGEFSELVDICKTDYNVESTKYYKKDVEITKKEYNDIINSYDSKYKFVDFKSIAKKLSGRNVVKDEANANKNQNTTVSSNVGENNSIDNLEKIFAGKYSYSETSDMYYHRSDVKITNMTADSVEFSINAAHGRNVDNVNIGEVSGLAKKIAVPENQIVAGSEQLAYEFKEDIDGKSNSIVFVFTIHKQFTYLNISENYESDFNPYAGHNVYFAGEYEKTE